MDEQTLGAHLFGAVVGWVTYYTLAHSKSHGVKDIAVVIGSVGGAAVLSLFPAQTSLFGAYGVGLAAGFFTYWAILFASPFFAYGWKGGWAKVSQWWAQNAMVMHVASDDTTGPALRRRAGGEHGQQ
jgi:hypothetical protein